MGALNIQLHKELGRLVQERRKGVGMSQEDLAQVLGMARSSIANIERGRQKISVETLYDLAQALRTEPAALLPPALSKPKKLPSMREIHPKASESAKVFVQNILARKGTGHDPESELE